MSIFVKLVPKEDESKLLVPVLAERLFQQQWIKPNTLTPLQISIQELFKKRPESSFLEEMYNITVDSVIHQNLEGLLYIPKLQPLVQQFIWSSTTDEYLTESIELYLNLLWHEENPDDFRKISQYLLALIPQLIDKNKIEFLSKILAFLTTEYPVAHSTDQQISDYREGALNQIRKMEISDHLIAQILDASPEDFETIGKILYHLRPDSVSKLLDAYMICKKQGDKDKYLLVFRPLHKDMAAFISTKLNTCEPLLVRELFSILQHIAPVMCNRAATSLLSNESKLKVWEALGHLTPVNDAQCQDLFRRLKKEKDDSFKVRYSQALLRSDKPAVLPELFDYLANNRKGKPLFKDTIVLSGKIRSKNAFKYLKSIIEKPVRRYSAEQLDIVKCASASLVQIHKQAAVDVLSKFLKEKGNILSKADTAYISNLTSSESRDG